MAEARETVLNPRTLRASRGRHPYPTPSHAHPPRYLQPPTRRRRRPPTVLPRDEVRSVLGFLDDPWKLAAQLRYGSGLRVMEALRLRVKDIDFGHGTITILDAKGGKHRLVPLPKALEPRLQSHLAKIRSPPTSSKAAPTSAPSSLFSAIHR